MFIHNDQPIRPLSGITPDPRAAGWLMPLIEQMLGVGVGMLCLRHSMPWRDGRALLMRVGTEALSQFELLCELFEALLGNLCAEDMLEGGLAQHYISYTAGIEPGCLGALSICGDPVTDIHSAIARAHRSRTLCDNLLRLLSDEAVADVIRYIRGSQMDAANALCALLSEIKAALGEQGLYAYNPAFDVCQMIP